MSKVWTILGFFLFVQMVPGLAAQTPEDRIIEGIYDALRKADYRLAETRADSALAVYFRFKPRHLAEIHALRALIYDLNGAEVEAANHLALAAGLDPALELDPLFFSPKMQNMFNELKSRSPINGILPDTAGADSPQIRYLPLPDPRVAAAWRSLLLPGWGQFYKGQKRRGTLISSVTAMLAASTLATHLLRQRAEQQYLEARTLQDIRARYDTFNRYHRWRNNLAVATGVTWLASFLDALFYPPPSAPRLGSIRPAVEITPDRLAIGMRLSWQ